MTRIEERHDVAPQPDARGLRGGPGALVPPGEIRTYYGRPVLKAPVWKKEIAGYLFTGGLAGASSVLAAAGRLSGRPGLARAARRVAVGGAVASPVLLIADLGKPERFANMLRVVRPTSPMNMGAWLLCAYGPSAGAAAVLDALGLAPGAGRLADASAAVTGALLTTYTGALLADTAVPVWHDARAELPFLFAAGAASSAGAAAAMLADPAEAGPALRLALAGLGAELAMVRRMERRLGPLASPYKEGTAGRWHRAATWLGLAGGLTLAGAGRRRGGAVAGGALLLASALATRFAVFTAGFQSAVDPEATIAPQRARLA